MAHSYQIDINGGCKARLPFIYTYSTTKGVELHVKKNKATIIFSMGVLKSQEQLVAFEMPLQRDAYRKVFLLHALQQDQNLNVKDLTITIDGQAVRYDKATAGFPFIYSMISKLPMGLPDSWRDAEIGNYIVSRTKTELNEDLPFISLTAFLSAKGRMQEVDRFANLWTAMNAYYNWYGELYNQELRRKYHYDKPLYESILKQLKKGKVNQKVKDDFMQLRDDKIDDSLLITGDAICMNFLIRSMDPSAEKLGKNFSNKTENRRCRNIVEQRVGLLNQSELLELYNYAWELVQGREVKDTDTFADLAKTVGGMDGNTSLFFFLVFDLPYYYRCSYFHGSKAPVLLAYKNEYEVSALRNIGFFVEHFLEERIPDMITGKTVLADHMRKSKDERNQSNNQKNQSNNKMKKLTEHCGKMEDLMKTLQV